MDLVWPELTGGWYDIQEFYGLCGNHDVYFDYVGNIYFKFIVFKRKSNSASVYKFYERI